MAEQTTIPEGEARTQTDQAVPSAGPFAIPWPFFSLDDVVVTLTDSDGNVATKLRGVDYDIETTANGDGIYPFGAITFTAEVVGVVTRYRATSIERLSNLPTNGFLDRVSLNADLNRGMAAAQDLDARQNRALAADPSDTVRMQVLPIARVRANKVLSFDSDGQPIATFPSGGGGLETELGIVYDTVAALEAAEIPAFVQYVQTAGYWEIGDFGGARYVRHASEPYGCRQSADGAYWKLAEPVPNIKMFGAKGIGPTEWEDTLHIEEAIRFVNHNGGGRLYVPAVAISIGNYYRVTRRIIHLSHVHIYGDGKASKIKNDREEPGPLNGDQSVFTWGAYVGSSSATHNVEDETFYGCEAITTPVKSIFLTNPAHAANFSIGQIVFIRNSVRCDTPRAGDRQAHWQHQSLNKITGIDTETGEVSLFYPHYRDDSLSSGTANIVSGTYDEVTGQVVLEVEAPTGLPVGAGFQVLGLTGTGDVALLSEAGHLTEAGTTGTTVAYTQQPNIRPSPGDDDEGGSEGWTLPGASTITGGTLRWGMQMAASSGTVLDEFGDPVLIRENVGLENLQLCNHRLSGLGITVFGGALEFVFRKIWFDGSDMFAGNALSHGVIEHCWGLVSSKVLDLGYYSEFIDIRNVKRYQTPEVYTHPVTGRNDGKCYLGQMLHDVTVDGLVIEGGSDDIIHLSVARVKDLVLRNVTVIAKGCTATNQKNPVTLSEGTRDFGPDGVTIENMTVITGSTGDAKNDPPNAAIKMDNPAPSALPEKFNRMTGLRVIGTPGFAIDITEGSRGWLIEGNMMPDQLIRNRSTETSMVVRNNITRTQNYPVHSSPIGTAIEGAGGGEETVASYTVAGGGASRTGGWRISANGLAATAGGTDSVIKLMFGSTVIGTLALDASMGTVLDVSSGTYDNGLGEVDLTMTAPHGRGVGETIIVYGLGGSGAYDSLEGARVTTAGTTGSHIFYKPGTGLGGASISGGKVAAAPGEWKIEGTIQNLSSNMQVMEMTGICNGAVKTSPVKRGNVSWTTITRDIQLVADLDTGEALVVTGWHIVPYGHDAE